MTGYCNRSYYDCNCGYWPLAPHPGSLQFVYQLGYDSYTIYWINTSYLPPTYTSCSNGNTCGGSKQTLNYTVTEVGCDPTLYCD